jgi:hypothetical protein
VLPFFYEYIYFSLSSTGVTKQTIQKQFYVKAAPATLIFLKRLDGINRIQFLYLFSFLSPGLEVFPLSPEILTKI